MLAPLVPVAFSFAKPFVRSAPSTLGKPPLRTQTSSLLVTLCFLSEQREGLRPLGFRSMVGSIAPTRTSVSAHSH
jgi:hypothetical protein